MKKNLLKIRKSFKEVFAELEILRSSNEEVLKTLKIKDGEFFNSAEYILDLCCGKIGTNLLKNLDKVILGLPKEKRQRKSKC